MTCITTTITIQQPIEQVFQYVTTAAHWTQWHLSSLGVTGAIDHSGVIGDQITEEFLIAGRRGSAVWTVRDSQPPYRWVIEGQVNNAGRGTITYTLSPQPNGTHFEREFVYSFHSFIPRLLDPLLIRPRIHAESVEALRRLKQVLESR